MSENHIRLVIRSQEISLTYISQRVGLHPDKCWKIGDCFEGSTVPRKENVWIFNAKGTKHSAIDEQIESLLAELRPHASKFLELSKEVEITISCAAYVKSPPPLFFDKKIIGDIQALGASLDIDLYFMED